MPHIASAQPLQQLESDQRARRRR